MQIQDTQDYIVKLTQKVKGNMDLAQMIVICLVREDPWV